jgi:hypothetical protein
MIRGHITLRFTDGQYALLRFETESFIPFDIGRWSLEKEVPAELVEVLITNDADPRIFGWLNERPRFGEAA